MDTVQIENNSPEPSIEPVETPPDAISPIAEPIKPASKGPPRNLIIGLIVVFILLVITAGGYYLMSNNLLTPNNSQLTTISPKVEPTIDPTADWEIFTAPEFYTIKYPKEWYQYGAVNLPKDGSFTEYFATKPDSENGWYELKTDDYSISLKAAPVNATTYESGKTYLNMFPVGQQQVGIMKSGVKEVVELVGIPKVDSFQGIEIERTPSKGFVGGGFYIREVFVQKGDYVFNFGFYANSRDEFLIKKEKYNQILSTFKFTQ